MVSPQCLKAQKTSSHTPNFPHPQTASSRPDLEDIQLYITKYTIVFRLVSITRIMNNPGAKIDVYKQVNFPKLKDNLQNKKYWSEEDDQLSRICYDYKQRNIYIYSNDDLQEVYKFAERLQIYQ